MSVERPELSCLCARLKVVEELWLLLGEVSVSAGRLKWLPQAAGAIPLLRQSAAMLPACCFSTAFVHQRKEFLELLLGFFGGEIGREMLMGENRALPPHWFSLL